MASIKDVAKRANVGPATVSRALNQTGYVSEQARERILQAMRELDYAPNELARNLFRKETRTIAILVPDIAHPFFCEFVKYAEQELYNYGFKTMICSTIKEHNCEREYLDMLRRYIVDGIITGVHSLEVEDYLRIKKPIVALDRYLGEDIPVVEADHSKGGKLCADIMLEHGCKQVIQFQGATAVQTPSHERHNAMVEKLRKNHVTVHTYELEWNRFENTYYGQVVRKALTDHPDADGIFGADLLAIQCLNQAVKMGRTVPGDLCIVAYDGTYITDFFSSRIHTIIQPIEDLAKESVSLVVDQINGTVYQNKRITLDISVRKIC